MSGVAWWSGGASSAVACKMALDDDKNCEIIFIDTLNEDDDVYRFLADCENWYGKKIEVISDGRTPVDIWRKDRVFLMVGVGAFCSHILKRKIRESIQGSRNWQYQVFGFDYKETKRARNMLMNNPEINPTFPLVEKRWQKADVMRYLEREGVRLPNAYSLGFNNNNCLKTGCPQGGVGYWQHYAKLYPDRFQKMVDLELELTEEAGSPRTVLRNAFLAKNSNYPDYACLSDLNGRHDSILGECIGFCGTDDPMQEDLFAELMKAVK